MADSKPLDTHWIIPQWEAPLGVHACVTTRWSSGSHQYGWEQETKNSQLTSAALVDFNLSYRVGDDPQLVKQNRQYLSSCLPAEPFWLDQVHGIQTTWIDKTETTCLISSYGRQADSALSATPNTVCAVLLADCMPVLFCNTQGNMIAAAHAGWRGLSAGVLEATVQEFDALGVHPDQLIAWLGPAIGAQYFVVGDEVREAFLDTGIKGFSEMSHSVWLHEIQTAFVSVPHAPTGKWYCDLYRLARLRLHGMGIRRVYGGGFCTYADARFYSHRRDQTQSGNSSGHKPGRMSALIWMNNR